MPTHNFWKTLQKAQHAARAKGMETGVKHRAVKTRLLDIDAGKYIQGYTVQLVVPTVKFDRMKEARYPWKKTTRTRKVRK